MFDLVPTDVVTRVTDIAFDRHSCYLELTATWAALRDEDERSAIREVYRGLLGRWAYAYQLRVLFTNGLSVSIVTGHSVFMTREGKPYEAAIIYPCQDAETDVFGYLDADGVGDIIRRAADEAAFHPDRHPLN